MLREEHRALEALAGQKILVTGGAGFVGSNLVRLLLQSEPREVIIVDNLLSAQRFNVPDQPNVTFIEGSIAENDILEQLPNDLDYVFHLATYHGNQNSIHDPLADHQHNTLTTLKLYETLKNFRGLRKVVYTSSGGTVAVKTYDTAQGTTEEAPVSLYLDSPYQISKIVGELYSNYYFTRHSLPVVKARFHNVYGPGEILGAGQWRGTSATVWRNVIAVFIYKALQGIALPIENHGIATRDFIYVEDVCRGLLACALRGKNSEVYNMASGQETSIYDLAILINEIAENPAGVVELPKRSWDRSGKRFGSVEKAQYELDFRARTSLYEGLKNTVAWTREHLWLIQQCIDKHAPYMSK